MKYKALFLDVDGTLIVHGLANVPTPRVIRAVNEISNSIHVCLATGRILSQILPLFDHLQLNGLCVIANGIQIYNPGKKRIIWERKVNKKTLPVIDKILKKYGLVTRVFTGDSEGVFDGNFDRNDVLSMWVDKVPPKTTEKVLKDLSHIPGVEAHRMSAWDQTYDALEVSDQSATKLHGIVEVAKRLHIKPEEIIGVGDSYNDFPLLMACGLKIAMGNAIPELKAIADFVAPSVEDDGVATIIEKFILEK